MAAGLPEPKPPPPKIDALGAEEKEEVVDPKAKKAPPPKGKVVEETKPEMTPEELAAARLRKYVEATPAAEGVPEMAAHWEFPFLEKLLEQAHAVLWTCSEYSAPATAEEEEKV